MLVTVPGKMFRIAHFPPGVFPLPTLGLTFSRSKWKATFSQFLVVFSTFYLFIWLFANKRIEYEVGANKIRALFVDTDKGALIRLFDYSQLKTKQGEASKKTVPLRVFTCNDLCRN